MFQQRHMEAIAATIKELRFPAMVRGDDETYARRLVAEDFAGLMARHNSKFKRDRFMRACGVD